MGSDATAYVVQIRAARVGVLDLRSTRPGVGVLGAIFDGASIAPSSSAPILHSVAIAVCLGLLAGVAVRSIYELPGWAVSVVATLVATWGGVSRLASGYLGNLMSLTLFILFLLVAVEDGGWRRRAWALVMAAASALLAHPGLLPVYLAIVVGWVALHALRPIAGDRGLDVRSEAVSAVGALVAAAALVWAVLFAVLGLDRDQIANFTATRDRFSGRVTSILAWLNPTVTTALLLAGGIAASVSSTTRRASVTARLGIAWIVVASSGALLSFVWPIVPGHRFLILGIPTPMLGGLAICSGVRAVANRYPEGPRIRSLATVTGTIVTAMITVTLASVTLRPFDRNVDSRGVRTRTPVGVVAGYLRSLDGSRPVVVITDPAGPKGVGFHKQRENGIRARAPDALLLRTVLYLGDERNLLRGARTHRSGPGADAFNEVSAATWPAVRAQLDAEPIVLAVRQWVRGATWRRMSHLSTSAVPDLAILRGPPPPGDHAIASAPMLEVGSALLRILSVVFVLGLLGGGWVTALSARARPLVDLIGLAPAVGIAVVVPVGLATALFGGDPGGPVGLALVGLAAAIGWIGAGRRRVLDPGRRA
ncbi:MAG TPA: hypothetical protein VFZ75_10145 [Actinomycetota bacterium]|nr:hypothetical protein [Actinomycetota bacterium]